ncbi:MAG: hypothetical protein WB439_12290 [Acidobacteriaceae bacterium]
MPYRFALLSLCLTTGLCLSAANASAQALPNAPSALLAAPIQVAAASIPDNVSSSSSSDTEASDTEPTDTPTYPDPTSFTFNPAQQATQQTTPATPAQTQTTGPVDANGKAIPLNLQQPHRLLGFMPNFRTVSAGAAVHPPGWNYNFTVASHQALDYSTFIFLGLTSLTAEGLDSHPALGKGIGGFYAYTWRGFLDKTDQTYLSAWLLPSLLHEDTRYYPLGAGHPVFERALYVISRQAVSRTYSEHDTPAFATLGGKALAQYISRFYYPTSSEGFGVLATKFGYSCMRDVGFSAIREFYPDIAAHYIRKHREKAAQQAARDAAAAQSTHPTT